MKKMKRFCCIILAFAVIAVMFAGCGTQEETQTDSGVSVAEGESGALQPSQTDETGSVISEAASTDSVAKEGSFFDNAVFVGDSVSLGFRNYVTNERNKGNECLGNCQFLVAGSMGFGNSLVSADSEYSIRPTYNGSQVTVWNGLNMMGAEKVFIMLGLNDFCVFSHEEAMGNAETFINRIVENNPGIEIYVQSVTPVTAANEHGKFTNQNIDYFNEGLKSLCAENGWHYVDVASVMKDGNNAFKTDYCNDNNGQGVHMAFSGSKAWADYLTECYG